MKKSTESLIYDMAFRVRLYIASKISENKVGDLTDRESLIIELLGMKGSMSISEIGSLYPTVSNSTISTTITKLWKDKKLVDKKKESDFNDSLEQIKLYIKSEIAAKLFGTAAKVESTFESTPAIQKAIEIFSDDNQYYTILNSQSK